MNRALWIPILLTLCLPTASAATVVDQEERVSQVDAGAFVDHRVNFKVDASFDPDVYFYTTQHLLGLRVSLVSAGVPYAVDAANVTKTSSVEGFDVHHADLRGLPVPTGDYTVRVTYTAEGGKSLRIRTWYASPSLTFWAFPSDGYEARPDPALSTTRLPNGAVHGGGGPTAANWTHKVDFVSVPATAASSDVSKYVWAGAGLLVGVAGLWIASRQGWVTPPSKSTKFVKGGAMESRTMLEARRRTLLAALKDLEQAHETKQIPDDAYAPLKEEYKAQAVRVMRNLEEKKEDS